MAQALRKRVANICTRLPGAESSDPWGGGHEAWKVGDKMFACFGAVEEGVSVKCADIETATMLQETGVAERAPYFHKSWVRLPESVDTDELNHRLQQSYKIIFSKLPAKTRKALASQEAGGEC